LLSTERSNRHQFTRLRGGAAGLRLSVALIRLKFAFKAGFRPNQPRVPAGSPEGGQWIEEDGDEKPTLVQSRGPTPTRPFNNGLPPINLSLQVRLDISIAFRLNAVREAQRIDPLWREPPQAYASIEGQIRANEAVRFQAELHIFRLTGRPPNPGPFTRQWLTSPAPNLRLTREQQDVLDMIGRLYGCHGCGSVDNWSPRGHAIGDHQIPRRLGTPSIIVPHCVTCSSSQGGLISRFLREILE